MNDLDEWRYVNAYNRLADTAMEEIDAAVFSGDMFMLEKNRVEFRTMMDRWESKLIQLEQIQRETILSELEEDEVELCSVCGEEWSGTSCGADHCGWIK